MDRIGFDNAFVFRYSPRKDTPAATLGRAAFRGGQGSTQPRPAFRGSSAHAKAKLGRARRPATSKSSAEGPSKTNPRRLTGRTPDKQDRRFRGSPAPSRANFRLARSAFQRVHALRRMRRGWNPSCPAQGWTKRRRPFRWLPRAPSPTASLFLLLYESSFAVTQNGRPAHRG